MIQVLDVSFAYEPRTRSRFALEHVSVRIERGAMAAVLGPNGSGKSTLMRIMAGIVAPDEGRVLLDGAPVKGLTRRQVARRLAVVPQDTHTTFDYRVLDIVLMGRYPHLGPFQLEGTSDLEIARDALAATGTAALAERSFATLSGGERQRVVIASALAQGSAALLLDEPTAALDLRYQLEIGSLLRRLNGERGTTVVLSTHDLNLAAALCDRVVLLKEGRVLADGRVQDALTPDNIRALYELEVEVQFHPRAGRLMVVPLERSR